LAFALRAAAECGVNFVGQISNEDVGHCLQNAIARSADHAARVEALPSGTSHDRDSRGPLRLF
jgi:hypothetical protein